MNEKTSSTDQGDRADLAQALENCAEHLFNVFRGYQLADETNPGSGVASSESYRLVRSIYEVLHRRQRHYEVIVREIDSPYSTHEGTENEGKEVQ